MKPLRETNKLLGLELLRFISAMAVLVFHYQHFVFVDDVQPASFDRTRQPLYQALAIFYEQGYVGVYIFWCISGFIFFWRYRESIATRLVGGRKFFILRFSRLYPLHFATLLLVAALQFTYSRSHPGFFVYSFNDARHFILQLFMASNWGLEKGYSFNGPIWSISLEVLVYGVFYLTLAYISKSWTVNILVLAAFVGFHLLKTHFPIVDCLAFFYAGGLSAIAYRWIATRHFVSWATIAAWVFVAAVPIVVYATGLHRRPGFPIPFLITYTPVVLYCLCGNFKTSPAVRTVIEAAGNMTYSSYLLHFPLQLALVIAFSAWGVSIPFYSAGFFWFYVLATLAASYFTFGRFELPAQNLLRRRFG